MFWLSGSSAQARLLWHMGLSYSTVCVIFTDQGSNPCPLHWQADSLFFTTGPPNKPQVVLLNGGNIMPFPLFSPCRWAILNYTEEGSPLLQIWENATENWTANTAEHLCQSKMLAFRLYLKKKQASLLFLSLIFIFHLSQLAAQTILELLGCLHRLNINT